MKVKKSTLDYLKREQTDYAILINGKWGSGKTYYWEKVIQPEIKKEGFEPIYVSLYGVTSISEIGEKILMSKMDYIFLSEKNNLLSKIKNWLNKVIGDKIAEEKIENFKQKGFQLSKTLINISDNKFGTNFKKDFKLESLINLDKSVLCFDDLERCNLPVEDIMGYINNFVEHDMIKTVIIANENQIYNPSLKQNVSSKIDIAKYFSENDKEIEENIIEFNKTVNKIFSEYSHYKTIKEKLIGKTVEFNLTEQYSNEVIDNLICQFSNDNENMKLKNNDKYSVFLEKKKNIIINTFNNSKKNIRSLKHGLQDFKTIYFCLCNNDLFNKINENLLIFTLAISFEIRSGDYYKEELEKLIEYDLLYYSPSGLINDSNENDYTEEVKFFRKITEKYYQEKRDLYFSPMIFQYVMKGFLNKEKLDTEIKIIKEEREKVTERRKVKPDLQAILNNWWNLDDKYFYSIIDDVIEDAEKGDYKIGIYPELFYKIMKFIQNKIINKNPNELKEKFENGIKNSRSKHNYNGISIISLDSIQHKFELYASNELKSKYMELCEDIKDITLKEIEEIIKEQESDDKKEIIKLLVNNPDDFFEVIYNNKQYIFEPIFVYIDIEEFIESIKDNQKFNNKNITELNRFLSYKYKKGNINDQYHNYKQKFYLLKERISEYLNELEKEENLMLRYYLVQGLLNTLDKIIKKIESNE